MSNQVVAKRYALALFELAKEQNKIDAIEAELLVVKEVMENNPKFLEVLTHPKLSPAQKKVLVGDAFSTLLPEVQNTLFLLLERNRITITVEMVQHYVELANESRNMAEATAYSVKPLTDDEKAALSSTFSKKVGKQSLRIINVIDPSLLGGVKIRIGNRIYDGSLNGKLERIQRELVFNKA